MPAIAFAGSQTMTTSYPAGGVKTTEATEKTKNTGETAEATEDTAGSIDLDTSEGETDEDTDDDTDGDDILLVAWTNKTADGVEKTTISAKSKVNPGSITVFWSKSVGYKVDGYQIFRSTKKNSGYGTKPFFTTKKTNYKNTKSLTPGTRYYYKVRGYRKVNGETVYTQWSNKVSRVAA
jgi:hypothetical protein